MSAVIDQARDLLKSRLTEVSDEQRRLERAIESLNGGSAPARSRKRGRGRPARRVTSRRKGGTRSDQALKLIEKSPGISASDIAKAMDIKPNYLYRVLGDLEKQGKVRKKGRTYTAR